MAKTMHDKEPPQVDDAVLRQFLGYNLKRAYLIVHSDFLSKLSEFDLRTPLFSTLALIVENPGASQTAIANALAVERSAMVLLIDDLEKRGLVVREKSPFDRRSYALHATPKGTKTCRSMLKDVQTHEDGLLAGLSDDERTTLISLLRKVGQS